MTLKFRTAMFFLFSVFILGVLFLIPSCAKATELVADGRAKAVIVVGQDVPDSVALAANELQSYIEQVSGVQLPIQSQPTGDESITNIFIGESEYTRDLGLGIDDLKSDGFRILTSGNSIAIAGSDYMGSVIHIRTNPWRHHETYSPYWKISAFGETGTLYGVYEFLRQVCGIRWYMPGEVGTVIPRSDRIEVGELDITCEPDFEYRYPWLCNFSETNDEPIWYRRVGFGAVAPVPITHSFRAMLAYKDTHPEYFALIDGQRDFTNLSTALPNGNLCLSNPGLLDQWVNDICDRFDAHPEQTIYGVCPEDGMRRICDCAECQAQIDMDAESNGRFSNYVWTFIDKVARGVAQRHPDKYVGCIAYEHYNAPPTCMERLSPNVAVMICKTRAGYNDRENWDNKNNEILRWHEKTDNIYIWEYYLQSWLPWRNLPIVFPHIISDDLNWLRGISNGEFIESESWYAGDLPNKMNFPGIQHFNLYVTARIYWDTTLDVDELLNEYFRLFYGPAEQELKAFWTTAEDYYMNADTSSGSDSWGGGNPTEIFTPERLETLMDLLQAGRAKTQPDSKYRQRIEIIIGEFSHAVTKMTNERVINIPEMTIASTAGSELELTGSIDKPFWNDVEPLTFVDKSGNEPVYATNAYLRWDDEYLYLAFENIEPAMANLQSEATQRDQSISPAVWDDDGIEIFICPDPDNRELCYQYIINADGVVWDAAHGLQENAPVDVTWNGDVETSSSLQDDRWLVEVRISLADMNIDPPIEGKTIAVNLYRNRRCRQPVMYTCWSPTLNNGHWTPSRFGKMTFAR